VEINPVCKCELPASRLSKVIVSQTYRCIQTDSGGLAIWAFGQCPVGWSVGVKTGPLGWAKITTE